MKQRIKKSPDLADSLTYAVEMLRKAGLEFTFEEEQESLDILEIRDWEEKLVYSKNGVGNEAEEQDDWGYGGSSVDPDGF